MESENLTVAAEDLPDVESHEPTIPELNAAVWLRHANLLVSLSCSLLQRRALAFYFATAIALLCVTVFTGTHAGATEMSTLVFYIISCLLVVLCVGLFLLWRHLVVVEQRKGDIEKTVALGYYPVLETSTPGVPVDSESA